MSGVVELASQLVAIESINPELGVGGSGEMEIARFVAAWCERAGLETTLSEPAPGRPNVVAIARGQGGGRSLILNAHTDTVGVAGMTDPLSARLEGGRLYGRGAYDMKGSLAACMLATAEAGAARLARRRHPHGRLRRGVRERRNGGDRGLACVRTQRS